MRAGSAPEEALAFQLMVVKVGEPTREHRFHPVRRWRFDFAWPDCLIAAEIEGGQWIQGRHNRGAGFEADCEKYSEAALLGWRIFRFTPAMVKSGYALKVLCLALPTK